MTDVRPDGSLDAFEQELHEHLARSVESLDPPTSRMERGARSRGTSLRRRRRAGVATAGLAAAAAAVALGALPGGGPGRAIDPVTSTPTPPPAEVRTGTAGATFPGVLGSVEVPARQLARRLRPLLPADVRVTRERLTFSDPAPGESNRRVGNVVVELDRAGDPTARGELEAVVYAAPDRPLAADDPDVLRATTCPAAGYDQASTTCTELDLGQGRVGRATESISDGFVIRQVLASTTSGSWVGVSTANSLDEKWGAGYTALPGVPPLTLAELEAVAAATVWADVGSR